MKTGYFLCLYNISDQIFVIKNKFPDIVYFSTQTRTKSDSIIVKFTKRCVVLIKDISLNGKTVGEIIYAREISENEYLEDFQTCIHYLRVRPKMRTALQKLKEYTPITVPSGFQYVIKKLDEFAVPNEQDETSKSGWIIKKKDVPKIMDTLPPITDSGILKRVSFEINKKSTPLYDIFQLIQFSSQNTNNTKDIDVEVFYDERS